MFCKEKESVANSALSSPIISNESSVTVATSTPDTMGIKER